MPDRITIALAEATPALVLVVSMVDAAGDPIDPSTAYDSYEATVGPSPSSSAATATASGVATSDAVTFTFTSDDTAAVVGAAKSGGILTIACDAAAGTLGPRVVYDLRGTWGHAEAGATTQQVEITWTVVAGSVASTVYTGPAGAGGGGDTPDPSAAPDDRILTVQGGAYVLTRPAILPCVEVDGAYPDRPDADVVLFIGPDDPGALKEDNDVWTGYTTGGAPIEVTISEVQSVANAYNQPSTPPTLTLPAAPTEGNLLVFVYGGGGGGAPTAPTGFTKVISDRVAGTVPRYQVAYKVAGPGESATVASTLTSSFQGTVGVYEYACSVGWPANPVDVTAQGTQGGTASPSSTGTTGAVTSEGPVLAVAAWGSVNGRLFAPRAYTNGFAEEQYGDGTTFAGAVASKTVADPLGTTVQTALSWDSGAANGVEGGVVVFKPAEA